MFIDLKSHFLELLDSFEVGKVLKWFVCGIVKILYITITVPVLITVTMPVLMTITMYSRTSKARTPLGP